ncbi:helix-turn-helix domain-containing protein [Pseudomonas juntendi]|uniref:Helix-turn-helix transcriptional regulator n=1 Tax=Pseudomonas juntendi TaxID=2666183 RepID=A0A7W2PTE9_9PSED|nr:helix-turn-helix transcriptional regulator [Pseudomonas juntendi]MBA6060169.1 helix-turn-helix transcriptional regulator [Pseudomonas juntendi]MBA6127308.1 helix-turn-helix transcriptional regulator [Pseudomonas juntendi]
MTLKTSFANVLRALRSKRNITQRDFADTTSRTYLSKLELGKSSITLDKLEQVSERLGLSPLTLLTLTLSEDSGQPAKDLISKLSEELAYLQRDGGLTGLKNAESVAKDSRVPAAQRRSRVARRAVMPTSLQTELAFID